MMTRNVDQFPGLVRSAAELGLERVSFKGHLAEILYDFPGRRLGPDVRQARDDSALKARQAGDDLGVEVEIAGFEFRKAESRNCSNNVGRRLYISATGEVAG